MRSAPKISRQQTRATIQLAMILATLALWLTPHVKNVLRITVSRSCPVKLRQPLSGAFRQYLMASVVLAVLSSMPAYARSLHPAVIGVKSILICVERNEEAPVRGLIDVTFLKNNVRAFLADGLNANGIGIDVSTDERQGWVCPDSIELTPDTLAVIVSVTVRQNILGAEDVPCCSGAVAIRYDRDIRRSDDDESQINFFPEPVHFGSDGTTANARALDAVKPRLTNLIKLLSGELPE